MLQLHYMAIGLTLKNKANFNVCVQVYFFLIRLYCWLLWTVLTWSVNGLITLINGESRISCPFEMMFCLTHTTNEKHAENIQTVGLLRLFFLMRYCWDENKASEAAKKNCNQNKQKCILGRYILMFKKMQLIFSRTFRTGPLTQNSIRAFDVIFETIELSLPDILIKKVFFLSDP